MEKKTETTITTYKGFNKDFKCRDTQYKVGKDMPVLKNAIPCETGYHACENPLNVLNYYNLCDSRFGIVEQSGVIARHNGDTKIASTKIKVKAELKLGEFIKASVNYLIEKIVPTSETAASGDCSKLAASGYCSKLAASGSNSQLAASGSNSQLAASGNNSKLAASGYYSQLAASGNNSKLAASGSNSQLAASGDYSKLAASGSNSKLAASGYCSQLAASGDYSKLAASGNCSKLEITGENSIGAAIGINNCIKGVVGTWITLAEYKYTDDKYICVCVKSAKIDGKKLLPDTWYKLENKKFVAI